MKGQGGAWRADTALLTCAVATLFGVNAALALRGSIWTIGLALIIAGGLVALISDRKNHGLRRWAWASGAVIAGFATLLLLVQLIAMLASGQAGRSSGLLPHANFASASAVAIWALVLGGVGVARSSQLKKLAPFVAAAASLMAVAMLALAGTRSVVGGVVVAVVVVLLVLRSSLGRARLLISLGVLVVVASLLAVGATVLRPDLVSGFFSTFERGPIFLAALDIAGFAPWVGLGDGAWLSWVGVVEPSLPIAVAPHTHSAYLTLLMEGGVFGLAAAVVMFALLVRWAVGRVRSYTGVGSVAFLACVVTLLVQSVVDVTLLHPAVYLPLALAGVLNAAGGGSYAQRSERDLEPQQSRGNAHG